MRLPCATLTGLGKQTKVDEMGNQTAFLSDMKMDSFSVCLGRRGLGLSGDGNATDGMGGRLVLGSTLPTWAGAKWKTLKSIGKVS